MPLRRTHNYKAVHCGQYKQYVLNMFIDIQTSKELIQMDINKKMRNGIFTMNGEHTQSEN